MQHAVNHALVFASCVAGALLLGGCDTQPSGINPRFSWQESVPDMRDALLGGCTFSGNTFAVGGLANKSAVYRWTSRRWAQVATNLQGARLQACWAGPGNRVIAVGEGGSIFHHSAEGWRRAAVPESVLKASLYGVWGMADGTAVAVGGGLADSTETAVLLHYDGQSWSRADASNIATKNLRGVWGTSPENYFAVGDEGAIAHFDGNDWRPSSSEVSDRLYGIYGNGPGEIYAVGGTGRGLVLRWNGSSWVSFHQPGESLRSVWTSPGNHLYVSGNNGFVGRYDRFTELPSPEHFASATPFPHLRVHTLVGVGDGIFGAAASMQTGDNGDWSGAVVSHIRSFAGPVYESPAPDASVPDSGPIDAGQDAGPSDAGP